MSESTESDDAPKLIIHTLCGGELFLYFGGEEDAKTLKNFNDISTPEGEAISPEYISECVHCGEKIRIDQLQVVHHEPKVVKVILPPTVTVFNIDAHLDKLTEDGIARLKQYLLMTNSMKKT